MFVPLEDDQLAAIDLRNGARVWTVPGRASSALTTDGSQVFLIDDKTLLAHHAETGGVTWRATLPAQPVAPPVAQSGWLIAPFETGALVAYRVADGAVVWMRDLGASANAAPTIDGDRLYVPLRDGRVVALAVVSGTPVWERRLGGPAQRIVARDGRLYLGSSDNFFYALDASSGVVAWRWRTGADLVGAPAVDDDRAYFVSLDQVIRALDRRSGAQRWRRTLPGRPSDGPLLAGGAVIVSNVAGAGNAFSVKDGAPAGDLEGSGPLAGPLHVMGPPAAPLPHVVRLARTLKGARASAVMRDVEPTVAPIAPLPNPVQVPVPGAESLTQPSTPQGARSAPGPQGAPRPPGRSGAADPPGASGAPRPPDVSPNGNR